MIVLYKAVCGLISVGILHASLVCVLSSYTKLYLGVVDIIVVAVSHQKDILSHIKRNLVHLSCPFHVDGVIGFFQNWEVVAIMRIIALHISYLILVLFPLV